ncbi:hypothetical protein SAMN04488047_12727 [Tranquillimonas alkanivorans]|uniref:Uncharacterized protein n=1 Tax=Tranquillimonas alkanivorans TaxID=441119 RepID=A0A1I5V5L2_9RHOB|nr:hypothetical protein SAMN04488047_12727 [Tranquillimonas alkanivorans]
MDVVVLALRRRLPEAPHFQRYEAVHCPYSPQWEGFTCNRPDMVQGMLFASLVYGRTAPRLRTSARPRTAWRTGMGRYGRVRRVMKLPSPRP